MRLKTYKNGGITLGIDNDMTLYAKMNNGTNEGWIQISDSHFSGLSYSTTEEPFVKFNKRSTIDFVIGFNGERFYIKSAKYNIAGNGNIYESNEGLEYPVLVDSKKHAILFNVSFDDVTNVALNSTHMEGVCYLPFAYDETTDTVKEVTSSDDFISILMGNLNYGFEVIPFGGGEPEQ